MRITVLGKSPAWQDAGGACSGYLVEAGGCVVLLDCGPGVFAKLRNHVDYVDVDAVVISHLHADHILDLVPFASGLRYAPRQQPVPVDGHPGTDSPARPRMLAPPGAAEAFAGMCAATGMSAEHIETAFELSVYDPAAPAQIGPLALRFQPVPHFVPCNAVEVAAGDARFTFSADSAPSDELCAFAAGTDLLLIEATLPRPERQGPRGHLTPAEAGEHGARAGAKQLVLTHFSDELDADWARAEAERTFGGPVEMAREGATYTLGE
ncbi:MAG TPA: MBL fold metallo-hydrolase [Solirubrobacter sp.]|nr:MBL fold metallo-hydrolase [Solirubrobacter sp.]